MIDVNNVGRLVVTTNEIKPFEIEPSSKLKTFFDVNLLDSQ